MLEKLRQLWEHAFWADGKLREALREAEGSALEALCEYAHIVGAEEVWLARLQKRSPKSAVWPDLSFEDVQRLAEQTHASYQGYLSGLRESDLETAVAYTNSAGRKFTNSIGDILVHVVLHGQYHRG